MTFSIGLKGLSQQGKSNQSNPNGLTASLTDSYVKALGQPTIDSGTDMLRGCPSPQERNRNPVKLVGLRLGKC